jgi:hypothetical protein
MKFFEDFSVTEKSTQYSVKFKGETLLAVNKKGLQFALASLVANENSSKDIDIDYENNNYVQAGKLVKIYGDAKKRFYSNKKLKVDYTSSSTEFKFFCQAVDIIHNNNVSYDVFIEAQVSGLAFVSKGKGVFPKPNQLCTAQAEDRLLNHIRDNNPDTIQAEIISREDYSVPLNENEKFLNYSKKVMEGTATLKEAKYVQKLYLIRKRKTSKKVDVYIEKLEDDLNE